MKLNMKLNMKRSVRLNMKLSTSKCFCQSTYKSLDHFVSGLSMKILAKQFMTNNVRPNMTPNVKQNMR